MGTKKTRAKSAVIPKKYVDAVNQGIKLLDLLVGRKEWLKRMDVSKFDIRHSSVCAAGNVWSDSYTYGSGEGSSDGYNRFTDILDVLGGESTGRKFGFSSDSVKGWQYLQDLWVMKVSRMKAAQGRK